MLDIMPLTPNLKDNVHNFNGRNEIHTRCHTFHDGRHLGYTLTDEYIKLQAYDIVRLFIFHV